MISFTDQYKILQNIIARSGGLDKINLASELAKVNSTLNGMNSQMEVSQMSAPQTPQGTQLPTVNQSIPPTGTQPIMPQNEGQGALQLP